MVLNHRALGNAPACLPAPFLRRISLKAPLGDLRKDDPFSLPWLRNVTATGHFHLYSTFAREPAGFVKDALKERAARAASNAGD